MLKLINEKALMSDSDKIKEAYMFDYLIQVNLTAVNGMSYILHGGAADREQSKKCVANVFFKVNGYSLKGFSSNTWTWTG